MALPSNSSSPSFSRLSQLGTRNKHTHTSWKMPLAIRSCVCVCVCVRTSKKKKRRNKIHVSGSLSPRISFCMRRCCCCYCCAASSTSGPCRRHCHGIRPWPSPSVIIIINDGKPTFPASLFFSSPSFRLKKN